MWLVSTVCSAKMSGLSVKLTCQLAMNMVIAFYAATFPGLVQDLPEVIKSEQDVMDGAAR